MTFQLPSEAIDNYEGLFYPIAKWAFDVTSGLFWVFMLLGFSVAIYMALFRLGGARAFGFAAFVGMTGAIWLATAGLMVWWIASSFILVGFIGLAILIMHGR